MLFLRRFWMILLLLTTACTSALSTNRLATPIFHDRTMTIPSTAILTEIVRPTVTLTPTPLKVIQTLTSTTNQYPSLTVSVIKQVCPLKREVPITDIGLSPTIRLILRDDKDYHLWIISGDKPEPQRIPNVDPFWEVYISPNQKWFAYETFKEKKNGLAYYDLWVSSVDGQKYWLVLPDIQGGSSPRWINDNEIELRYWPDHTFTCPDRILSVNPFIMETKVPPPLPINPTPLCMDEPILNPDKTKAIYLAGKKWNMIDFTSGEITDVFPWLTGDDLYPRGDKHIFWDFNSVTMVFPRSDRIDYLQNIPEKSITDASLYLNSLYLPIPGKIWNEDINWWYPEKGLAGIDLQAKDGQFKWPDEMPTTQFMVVDLVNLTWSDYCLDRANIKDKQGRQSYYNQVSFDGHFLGWTIMELPGNQHPLGFVILDLQTGRMTTLELEGYEFLGWGEIQNP